MSHDDNSYDYWHKYHTDQELDEQEAEDEVTRRRHVHASRERTLDQEWGARNVDLDDIGPVMPLERPKLEVKRTRARFNAWIFFFILFLIFDSIQPAWYTSMSLETRTNVGYGLFLCPPVWIIVGMFWDALRTKKILATMEYKWGEQTNQNFAVEESVEASTSKMQMSQLDAGHAFARLSVDSEDIARIPWDKPEIVVSWTKIRLIVWAVVLILLPYLNISQPSWFAWIPRDTQMIIMNVLLVFGPVWMYFGAKSDKRRSAERSATLATKWAQLRV